jgi:hypothetical protein
METSNMMSEAEPIPKSQCILHVCVTIVNAQHVK